MARSGLKGAWRAAVVLIAWGLLLAGCGIKGPPVAPKRTPPAPVADLRAVVEGESIRMTWSLGKSAAEGRSAVEGFHVYRWQNPISETACPGCPRVYERIADVGVESGTAVGDRRLDFSHEVRLPRGYRYAFKVIAYTRDRLVSGDSNILDFEY